MSKRTSRHTSKLPRPPIKSTQSLNDVQAIKPTQSKENKKSENQKPAGKKTSATLQPSDVVKRRHLSVVEDNVPNSQTSNETNQQKLKQSKVSPEKTKTGPKVNTAHAKPLKDEPVVIINSSKSAGEKAESKAEKEKRRKFLSCSDSLDKHKRSWEKRSGGTGRAKRVLQIPTDVQLTESVISSPLKSPPPLLPEDVINIDIEDGMYEYGAEIVSYLKEKEKKYVLPEDFIKDNAVTETMRSILVDWLIQVQHHLKLSQECLYLAISMLDTVLTKRDVEPDKLQLVGVTSLWLASKLEEYYPAELDKLIHLTENSYNQDNIIKMEVIMLRILEFEVYVPETMVFLLRFVRAALRSNDEVFLKTCQYLVDSFVVKVEFSTVSPSVRAAASVLGSLHLFSAVVLDEPASDCWTSTLVYYTKYDQDKITATTLAMLDVVYKAATNDTKYMGAYTKYKSFRQHKRLVLQQHLQPEVIKKAIHSVESLRKVEN